MSYFRHYIIYIRLTDLFIKIIFKTTDPYLDHWSDPVHFTFEGYDTSPFWDVDGKTYIVGSHEYKVFPMIQGFEIDLDTGVSGPILDLWPGTGGHVSSEYRQVLEADGDDRLIRLQKDRICITRMTTII